MGRQLLGYRIRCTIEDRTKYAMHTGDDTFDWVEEPYLFHTFANRILAKRALPKLKDSTDVKIVAVYLKTNEYKSSFASERVREDLSDFNRAVLDEIDRRNIDAIVEPEMPKGSPTVLAFRASNGSEVWLPIVRYAVVDGPKKTRARRTIDRMLQAIHNVRVSLSGKSAAYLKTEDRLYEKVSTGKIDRSSADAILRKSKECEFVQDNEAKRRAYFKNLANRGRSKFSE